MAPTSPQFAINLKQPSYRRLRATLKERTRPVVLWCGAGLSMPAGLPNWDGLKRLLLNDLEEKALSFDEPERERLLRRAGEIDEEADAWRAFTQLEQALGEATFKAGVREHLAVPKGAQTPTQYIGFWSVKIRGVVNLNLDRLATQAYVQSRRISLLEIHSNRISTAPSVIGSGKEFVLNLHGVLEDVETWILTHTKLKNLQNSTAYKTTLSALFTNFAVLFSGISADDVAASGFLASLTEMGIDLSEHYWMTERSDPVTDRWAEAAGLQIIRYSSDNGHDVAFNAIFEDLTTFVPQDEIAPAVRTDLVKPETEIPEPMVLASQGPEEIRSQITAHAGYILGKSSEPVPEEYREFMSLYARAIYNAWYVSSKPPDNSFFGYHIEEALGDGAFSNVYKATAPDGSVCAIKIMHEALARDDLMLSCFRRGISSMRILEERQLDGIVRLIDAVELPAAIFMEYIDGPTLEQAVDSRLLDPWNDCLGVLVRVTEIIREGHRLPERVLHRDLRPSNIMLRNFYAPDMATEITILDFDLSWHRGAFDMTVKQHAQTALGYLAPEQIRDTGVSTRSSAVDTHGLCAMIYFVFTGEHPPQGLFQSHEFQEQLQGKFASAAQLSTISVGNRLRRLVTSGVAANQAERPDFGEVYHELQLLDLAIRDQHKVDSPDFWAEELLCRTQGERGYLYEADNRQYTTRLISGMQISIGADFENNSVGLQISYASKGNEDRRNVIKFLQDRVAEALKIIENAGFNIERGSGKVWSQSYSIQANAATGIVQENSDKMVSALKKVIDRLSLN